MAKARALKSLLVRTFTPVAKALLSKKKVEELKQKTRQKVKYDFSKHHSYEEGKYQFGINYFGHLKAEIGLGVASRLYGYAIERINVPHLFIDIPLKNEIPHKDTFYNYPLSKQPLFSINVIHINPENMFYMESLYEQNVLDYRYNIGAFLTELSRLPKYWQDYIPFFDEFWVCSTFEKALLESVTTKPITVIPYGLDDSFVEREALKQKNDKFTFLSVFDGHSSLERKNIIGTINAFKKAFNNDEDVLLIIKAANLNKSDCKKLDNAIMSSKNIRVINRVLPHSEVINMIEKADCLVSLHRAEGFGLVPLEAMFLKTPVIATNYSATTDFLKSEYAYLVSYKLVECEVSYQDETGFLWADPSIDDAVKTMQLVKNDESLRNAKVEAAHAYARRYMTHYECASIMNKRIMLLDGGSKR